MLKELIRNKIAIVDSIDNWEDAIKKGAELLCDPLSECIFRCHNASKETEYGSIGNFSCVFKGVCGRWADLRDRAARHQLYRSHGGEDPRHLHACGYRAHGARDLSAPRRVGGRGRDRTHFGVRLSARERRDEGRSGGTVRGAHGRARGGKRGRERGGRLFLPRLARI